MEQANRSDGFESYLDDRVANVVSLEIFPVTTLEEVLVGLHPNLVVRGFAGGWFIDEADAEFVLGRAPNEYLAVNSAAGVLVYQLLGRLRKFADASFETLPGAIKFP